MTRPLARLACELAALVLPARQKAWGEAMRAELVHIADDRSAIGYAGGCMIAAIAERGRDFETRFAAGLSLIALLTLGLAAVRLACAIRGLGALSGGPDSMLVSLSRPGADAALQADYLHARPIVIGCFFALGTAQFASAVLLWRREFRLAAAAWCAAAGFAGVAVAIQLSVIPGFDGVPSEFHAVLLQLVALPALFAWSAGRHLARETIE